jgi:hypothetical protein
MKTNQNIDVDILVNGKPVRKYSHESKTFIEARDGTPYSIRIKNNSHKQILVICSVDGINVISGEKASNQSPGYVIRGYHSFEIEGFRTSNEKVNSFKFAKKSNSYAAKSEETKGDTSTCGVIGILVFEEQEPSIKTYPPYFPWDPWDAWYPWKPTVTWGTTVKSNSPLRSQSVGDNTEYRCMMMSCSITPEEPQQEVFTAGTEFSKQEITSKVTDVEFQRGQLILDIDIFYDFRPGLEKLGVQLDKTTNVAFPSSFPKGKFCKPPNG